MTKREMMVAEATLQRMLITYPAALWLEDIDPSDYSTLDEFYAALSLLRAENS